LRDADAGLLLANGGANSLPIITIPALATAGYGPVVSAALGCQAFVAASAAVAPVVSTAWSCWACLFRVEYTGVGFDGRKKHEEDPGLVSALPVVTLPADATAVVASGAIGGQGPVAAIAANPAILQAAVGYAGLGYDGLGHAVLGYASLGHAGLGFAGLGYAGPGHAGLDYGHALAYAVVSHIG
jgi:hypothetical protein